MESLGACEIRKEPQNEGDLVAAKVMGASVVRVVGLMGLVEIC